MIYYKNQLSTKENRNARKRGQKCYTYRKQIVKWQNSLLISNYFKYKWNTLSEKSKIRNWPNGLKKYDSTICCLENIHFRSKDTNKLKMNMEKVIPCNGISSTWKRKEIPTLVMTWVKLRDILLNKSVTKRQILYDSIYTRTKSFQSCQSLCAPIVCNQPGSFIHGIF